MDNSDYELNKLRSKIKSKKRLYVNSVILFIILLIIFFSIFIFINNKVVLLNDTIYLMYIFSYIFSIYIAILYYKKKYDRNKYLNHQFQLKFKEKYVLERLKQYFNNLKYYSTSGVDKNIINETQMIIMGNYYGSQDFISATYQDITFECSNLQVGDIIEGHVQSYFSGLWLIIDYPKIQNNDLKILDLSSQNIWNLTVAEVDREFYGYKKINVESIEFNQMFDVYAKNEQMAFYILTPLLISKILNLKNKFDYNLRICFLNNKLHIGINNLENAFDYSNYEEEFDYKKVIQKIDSQIHVMIEFIQELNEK